jgi:uncharacterized protein YecE (DUF72 family)
LDQDSVRIGTSGWSYKEWEGVFYPDSKTPKLTFYSGIFKTAEIDSTFYANPSKGLVLGWLRNTPNDFEFSVKLPQSITHKKQLDLRAGAEVDLLEFLDLMEPLREKGKLGPLLIQLPPSFGSGKFDKLEEFLEAIPKKKNYYNFAIEFRNKSWLNEHDRLNQLLTKYNVSRTIVDEPLLPVDPTLTADFAFVRWHGRGERPWYNYQYKEKELDPWVERVRKQIGKTKVYGYFNNHFHGYAVENALQFLNKLGVASQEQTKTLATVSDSIESKRNARHSDRAKNWETKKRSKRITHSGQRALTEF